MTLKTWIVCIMAMGALTACEKGPVGNAQVPQPAKPVELSRYLGTWYEIARYENRFEKGCEQVTAEYGLLPDKQVSVTNRCYRPAEQKHDVAEGKAKVVEGSGNAKLRVAFFWPFYGDYWVLDHAADYSWSIVGEPEGRYLWILARTPDMGTKQKQRLWKRAQELGYDTGLLHEVQHNVQKPVR